MTGPDLSALEGLACTSCGAELCASCEGCTRPDPTTCQGEACICPGQNFRPDDMPYAPEDAAADDAAARMQEREDEREWAADRQLEEQRDDRLLEQLERGRRP